MKWSDIHGWFDFHRLYREAVERAGDGAHFVEIGAWLGRSTAFMAEHIDKSGKKITFDAVDTWDGGTRSAVNERLFEVLDKQTEPVFDQFIRNMHECGVQDRIRYVKGDSGKASENSQILLVAFRVVDNDNASLGPGDVGLAPQRPKTRDRLLYGDGTEGYIRVEVPHGSPPSPSGDRPPFYVRAQPGVNSGTEGGSVT